MCVAPGVRILIPVGGLLMDPKPAAGCAAPSASQSHPSWLQGAQKHQQQLKLNEKQMLCPNQPLISAGALRESRDWIQRVCLTVVLTPSSASQLVPI